MIDRKIASDETFFMKSCPSCLRDVPSSWDICIFCGNVFRKTENETDGPSMLFFERKKSR
jgi:rRNA maturation endonuclease Nob1